MYITPHAKCHSRFCGICALAEYLIVLVTIIMHPTMVELALWQLLVPMALVTVTETWGPTVSASNLFSVPDVLTDPYRC